MTLTFDLLTPKTIGVIYSTQAIILWSFMTLGQRILKLLSGNGFHTKGHCDLDLWPIDPHNNRDHLLNTGNHPMKFHDFRSKGFPDIERKRSVYGPTDRLTLAKQYTPASSKGGININTVSLIIDTLHWIIIFKQNITI